MVKPEKGDSQKAQEKNVLMLYKYGFENGSRVYGYEYGDELKVTKYDSARRAVF